MTKQLNWGIITTGWIARKFATDLRQSRTGRLVAVGARQLADAQKFAADFGGATAHGSYGALLADPAVEAVYIAPRIPDMRSGRSRRRRPANTSCAKSP